MSVLIGIERLLFGGSTSSAGSSFGLRAFGYVDDLTSPVTVVLLVGAVLLAGHLGPVIKRMKMMVYVAVGMLGLTALFGLVGLFGGLFSGDATLGRKVEFLLLNVPGLALAVIALLYLLPKAASAAPQVAGLRAEGGFGHPQEQHAYPQGGHAQPVPQQGFQAQGFPSQEQAPQGGQGYQQGYQSVDQASQQGYQSQDQASQQGYQSQDQHFQQQGFASQEQAPQQGYQPQGQVPQGGHAQQAQSAPQQGFPPQEQAPQGGQGYQQGYQSVDQASQQGYQSQDQHFQQQGFASQEQAPQQGYQPQGQVPQGGHAQQAQSAPASVPQVPYSQPALPPARSSATASDGYGQQSPHSYAPPAGDGYSPAAYAPPVETHAHGGQAASYAPAQPASQVPPPAPAETYTPSPYVAADAQPPAPVAPYDPPVTAYDPPVYAAPAEQPQQQAPGYPDSQLPGYPPPAAAQFPGYPPQPEQQQASFYQPQSETYQPQSEAPAPYTPADSPQRAAFDGQEQSSFPQPPENYGQPFTGYSGAEFARPTEPNLHYPAPGPVDPRSQQMAQAYQQAETYQQQAQGTEPQLQVPEYGASPQGGSYDGPFGHPQTSPAAQPYQQQSGHQWDPPADATLRFDPSSYQGDPLGGNSWDSQPAIDPTAIYRPERSAQVMGEESSDRERVGPGQEENMSWYGSDRREH
ncbi:hypothetical protein FHR32_004180 [Streptosporangium album]|uniref:Uncharacterized protein n=1 Tax=Streptosporangium album TaxID=47479 RepID=A0A7W7RXC7_9ACTN|nr:hypothetical protein [Streptosporangium album]MBB4939875.1 hypothetical protein [Streptosporangium album]